MSLAKSRFLAATVTIAPFSSYDDYGSPTHGADATYSGRYLQQNEMVRITDGEEKISTGQLYVDNDYSPNLLDKVTLADGSNPKILQIQESKDRKNNTYYWKLSLE
jgi:hypothetical protein